MSLFTPITETELKIYKMRESGMTFKKIAENYPFTLERANQIYRNTVRKIRLQKLQSI